MITVNEIFNVSQALSINYYQDYIIPYQFLISQKIVITIFNADNINQDYMGLIIPYSQYNINGQLDYGYYKIYRGNVKLEFNPLDNYYLKFRPSRNGLYFISIGEIIGITTPNFVFNLLIN